MPGYSSSALSLVNRIGNFIPHRGRRFILDRLGLGKALRRVAGGNTEMTTLSNGYALVYNPLLHSNVLNPEGHEPELIGVLEAQLKKGSVFYDVGANIGIYSLLAADYVGPEGKVLAFEPNDLNLSYLRQSIALGVHNVEVLDFAIGDKDGTLTFDRKGGSMSGRLISEAEKAVDPQIVKVRSIDSLIESGLPPPDVIKIDIEGGEGAALEGAVRTLERGPVIICEMHEFAPEGVKRAESVLMAAGYNLSTLHEGKEFHRVNNFHVVATKNK